MAILNEHELHQLALLAYVESRETAENKRDALIAMNILPKEDGYTEQEYAYIIYEKLNNTLDEMYLKPVDTICILQEKTLRTIEVNVPDNYKEEYISWEIVQKNDKKISGKIRVSETNQVLDFEQKVMQREVGGVNYKRRSFELSQELLDKLDFDYHTLKIQIPGIDKAVETELAYAPEKCYQPINPQKEKVRGTSVAIPSLRSNENLGIGNYSDMAQFSFIAAQNNLDIVGVLPIHAMNHKTPEAASFYSPNSRTFFNFGLLDITAIDDFKKDQKIQKIYDSEEYKNARRKNQDAWTIDYTTSYELLMPMLKETYKSFLKNSSSERMKEFAQFKKDKGEDLRNFALFQSLTEYFCSTDPQMPDWRDWPEEYQNPETPEVKSFADKNSAMIDFFSYLQWESVKQIKNIQKTCKDYGMKIGLYMDLAVGTIPGGFESWAYKKLYIKGSLGIPPDMCSAEGQNWGIISYNPSELIATGFKSFRKMMEANMVGGMLRIDCPLCGFVAANLIPEGKNAKDCFSVYMPTDKMMALTALTSHRTQTPIVFEDLGAIPEHFREKIQRMNGITYKVLPYEYCSTRDFPSSSLVVSSTHDSESQNIGWKGASAYKLAKHNCLPEEYINDYLKGSFKYRQHISGLMKAEGIADFNPEINDVVPKGYYKALAKLIGNNEHCTSAYGIMPIADVLGLPGWRENIPGTAELHTSKNPNAQSSYSGIGGNIPNYNWRLKLPLYLNEIAINPRFLEVTSALSNNPDKKNNVYARPGRKEPFRRDPERLVKLFTHISLREEERIANGEKPRFSKEAAYAIWGAKYSEKKKAVLIKKATQQKEDNLRNRKAIERKRSEYRQSLMNKKVVDKNIYSSR